jgi:predicted transposase YbfD/YdcC
MTATATPPKAERNLQFCYDGFSKHFVKANDYRRQGSVQHKLVDILFFTLCACISGANDLASVAEFTKTNESWFVSLLGLKNGVPSESTFRMVFMLLDPAGLSKCFVGWTQELAEKSMGRVTAIDGKAQRGTALPNDPNSFVHIVNAWAADSGLTLGQLRVDGKSNEITAIPELLKLIDVEGSIVTIDAMGAQTSIADLIVEKGADYILALKGNQSSLHSEVENFYSQALEYGDEGIDYLLFQEGSSGHGREEVRRIYVTDQFEFLTDYHKLWKGLRSIVCIETERTIKGHMTTERRYYITTLPPDPSLIGRSVRSHWGVENQLHWSLDVALREDAQKARLGHVAENMALARRMTLNLLTGERTCKRGVATKRLKAAWSKDYLLRVLSVKFPS